MTEAIFTTAKRLFEHLLITNVDTRDKTLNTLITAFLLTTTTYLFSICTFSRIRLKFNTWWFAGKSIEYPGHIDHIREYMAKNKSKFTTVSLVANTQKTDVTACNKFLHEQLAALYDPHSNGHITQYIIDPTVPHSIVENDYQYIYNELPVDKLYPVKVNGIHIIAIKIVPRPDTIKANYVHVMHNNVEFFESWISVVKLQPAKVVTKTTQKIGYFDAIGDLYNKNIIHGDRNFDSLVSHHKENIISLLDSFVHANAHGSGLGGYGTYNVGIMLQGPPGTGKTLMMKAIANYLKRDIVVINMSTLSSITRLREIFDKYYKTHAFVLDEFDFIQNVICSRNDVHENPLDKLQERYDNLLKIRSTTPATETKSEDSIEAELARIRTLMDNYRNRITLESLLTLLDGVTEYRGRVIIACTNYIDRIDSALLRPGRFDMCMRLDKFTAGETRELAEKMFGHSERLTNFKFPNMKLTAATIINLAQKTRTLDKFLDAIELHR